MDGIKKAAGTILLAAVSVVGLNNPSLRQAYCSTRGFFCYFQSIEKSTLRNGLWERVALSLVLASADSPLPECAKKAPKIVRSSLGNSGADAPELRDAGT